MIMPLLDHAGLLTLARKAHLAAEDADAQRLAYDLDLFVDALVDHLDHEAAILARLSSGKVHLMRRRQAEISATARELLAEARTSCTGSTPRCAARAEELLALLTLQARDERLAFDDPVRADP